MKSRGRVREEKRKEEKRKEEKRREEKRREEKKKEDQGRERVRRQTMQVREKGEKSRNTVFLQRSVAPEGRKVGSLQWQVRSPSSQMRNEKVQAVVARSTFPSQNAENTSVSEHFWKLRCRNSGRRCGA